MVLGELDSYMNKNEIRTFSNTIHKNKLKMDKRLTCKTRYYKTLAAAAAKLLQSCPTLCDPIDGSPPGPAVPGILQARTLEWVAISSSNA